jgi:hypothetical protein
MTEQGEDHPSRAESLSQAQPDSIPGSRVRTLLPLSGVPAGSRGLVIADSTLPDSQTIAVAWELPERLFGMNRRPLIDYFTPAEYRRFLAQVTDGEVSPKFLL